MSAANDHVGRAKAESEAVAWLMRLDAPDATEADWQGLADWLEAAPQNRLAFDRAERLSFEVAAASPDLIRGLDAAAPKTEPAPRRRRRTARSVPIGRWGWAAGLLAAACFALVMFPVLAPPAAPTEVYQTAKGETRMLILADGTRINLNSDSHISVRLEARARRVEMARGEAAFDVAHDNARPFLIAAGDRRIRVVGTEFDVLDTQGLVRVTVRRGVVGVASASAGPDAQGVLLRVGDQFEHRVGEAVSAVHKVDPEVAFAWRRGDLIYRDQPLSEIVGDLNRYFVVPVRVTGPAADLKFSGVLVIDTEEAVVARLQAFLPISVDRAADGLTLRLRTR
ncbi:MAG TPA: FecR domain-containing protein [Caulobacteraceae bacterium]|jgi:transmembrane sensor|nr:FecR domain-containing protein [Caulobacteraceae bacterium]